SGRARPRRAEPRAPGTASPSRGLPEGEAHLLLDRQLRIDLRKGSLGLHGRVAELDERVAGPEVTAAGRSGDGAELLLQLEHDALSRLLADSRDRLEARGVLERDRAAQV